MVNRDKNPKRKRSNEGLQNLETRTFYAKIPKKLPIKTTPPTTREYPTKNCPSKANRIVVVIELTMTMYIPVEEATKGCFPISMRSGL